MKAPKAKAQKTESICDSPPKVPFDHTCGPILQKIHDAMQAIKGHNVFAEIEDQKPLPISEGGRQAPFVQSDCTQVLENSKAHYQCAGNLFWQNFCWFANARTPVNPGQIKQLQGFELAPMSPPESLNFTTVIALDDQTMDVMKSKGALQRLSPPEPAIAVLFSIWEAIKLGAGDNVIMKWRSLALTASFRFEVVCPGDDRYWRAQNIRQECTEHGEVAQMSVRQWIYDVVGFKDSKEKELQKTMSAATVSKMYDDHMKYARGTERIKESFVDCAITIFNRVLNVPAANRWLGWCEEHLIAKSPWKSIYALQALVDRARTEDRVIWGLWGLVDHFRMEYIDLGVFTISKLKDYRQSYVEILNLKLTVKKELLEQWLPKSGMDIQHISKIKEVMADFGTVRNSVTPYPGQSADTTWLIGRPLHVQRAVELIEELVYTNVWDCRYKDAIKSKLAVEDFLDYESIRQNLAEILQLLKSDTEGQAAAAGASSVGEADAAVDNAEAQPAQQDFQALPQVEQVQWDKFIEKQIRTYIHLIPDQKTQAGLEKAISDCPIGKFRADPTGLVLYHFDVKQCGEPLTRPELRTAPLRDAHYNRLVRATLNARSSVPGQKGHLKAGEVAIVLDGSRKGNATKLLGPWKEGTSKDSKSSKKDEEDEDDAASADADDGAGDEDQKPGFVPTVLQLAYTEESIAARRRKARSGMVSIHQIEWCHVIAHARICLPPRTRKYFSGSTSGDLMVGLEQQELSQGWQLPWKSKKLLFGKKNLIPVGGKTAGIEDDPPEKRTDDTMLPVCYHGMPMNFYLEMVHTFYAKSIVDLTPLDGKFAWAALQTRVGYLGICFTEDHVELLYGHLRDMLRKDMGDSASPMFNKDYAKAIGKGTPEPAAPKPKQPQAPKPKQPNKPAPKPTQPNNPAPKAKQGSGGAPQPTDPPQPEDPI